MLIYDILYAFCNAFTLNAEQKTIANESLKSGSTFLGGEFIHFLQQEHEQEDKKSA